MSSPGPAGFAMRLFQFREKDLERKAGYVDTQHKWGLPGVSCDGCGSTWGTTGLEYPSINLGQLPDVTPFLSPWPVPVARYKQLEQTVFDSFPHLSVLAPGAVFGASVGRSTGKLDGFVWGAWWTALIEEKALERLRSSRLRLPVAIEVELESDEHSSSQRVFEFDLPLEGRLANGVYDPSYRPHCLVCGRDGASLPDDPIIETDLVTGEFDIFRVSNFTTLILVTEKFVDTVAGLGIRGALLEEISTSE